MMNFLRAFVTAFLVLALGGPALASDNKSNMPTEKSPTPEAVKTFYAVINCGVGRKPKLFEAFMLKTEHSPGYGPKDVAEILSSCLTKQRGDFMNGRAFLWYGAIGQRLYVTRFRSLPQLSTEQLSSPYSESFSDAERSLAKLGECAVRKYPGHVDRLIRTDVESADEANAFGALSPQLSNCAEVGSRLVATKFNLRLALADALYRRVLQSSPKPAVGEK